MIKTELRIGNLVEYPNWNNDGTKAYFKIRDIYFDDNKVGLTNGIIQVPCTKLDYIVPIPLTEEWLLKAKFDKYTDFEFSFDTEHFCIGFFGNELDLLCGMYAENPVKLKGQKYVHQLQNLYFALTGEELEFTK